MFFIIIFVTKKSKECVCFIKRICSIFKFNSLIYEVVYKITAKVIHIISDCECEGVIDPNKNIIKFTKLIMHDVKLFETEAR